MLLKPICVVETQDGRAGWLGAGLRYGISSVLSYAEYVPEETLTGVQKSRTRNVKPSAHSMIKSEPKALQKHVCLFVFALWEVLVN